MSGGNAQGDKDVKILTTCRVLSCHQEEDLWVETIQKINRFRTETLLLYTF